jgi:hypothetical protein
MRTNESHYQELVKRNSRWRYMRWLQLLGGIIVLSLGAFYVLAAHKRASTNEGIDNEIVVYYPLGMILFAYGTTIAINVLAKWSGDPLLALFLNWYPSSTKSGLPEPTNEVNMPSQPRQ